MGDDPVQGAPPPALACVTHPGVPAIGHCTSCAAPLCALCLRIGERRGEPQCPACRNAAHTPHHRARAAPARRRVAWRALAIAASFLLAAAGLAYIFHAAWTTAAVEGEASGVAARLREHATLGRMRTDAREAISETTAVPGPGGFPLVAERVAQSVVRISTGDVWEARGTGFIVSQSGDILTAAHVVEGGAVPEVAFANGRRRRATILAMDERNDVALLHVDEPSLPPLYLGSSTGLPIGTEVAVLGYPLNTSMEAMGFREFTPTLVQGIIAARQSVRPTPLSQPISILQIDANLNPGHSGGPVFLRSTGEVVGIANSAIESVIGGKTDICFAVPIDVARAELGI